MIAKLGADPWISIEIAEELWSSPDHDHRAKDGVRGGENSAQYAIGRTCFATSGQVRPWSRSAMICWVEAA
jgi:hypothetical protein